MTNAPSNTPASKSNAMPAQPDTAANRQIVLKEVGVKRNKFSEQDLSALKSKDDLISEVVAKYGIEKAQAQRDVDALLRGRRI